MRYGSNMNAETILVASTRTRDPGQLDCLWAESGPMPSLASLLDAVEPYPGPIVIGGGEPTLRPDLPALLAELGERATLATDGLALHRPDAVKVLTGSGLRRVRLGIHSARADAHDWLVGIPGAHRRIRTAVQTLLQAGVIVETETVLTRPTAPYLEELVAFVLKLGVRHLHFRPIRQVTSSDARFAATAPRFSLMQPSLDAAVRLGLRQGATIRLTDLPHCAIPGFPELYAPSAQWCIPAGISPTDQPQRQESGCADCTCDGAPSDYVSVYGWTEFTSEASGDLRPVLPTPHPESGADAIPPPARSTLAPATRVAEAIRLSAHANLGGDPMPAVARPAVPDVVAIAWGPEEPTRPVKQRMVQAAQVGASTLQLLGDLHHPEALHLVREALRLSFPRVVLTADLSGLAELEDKILFQLRELHEIWTPDCPVSEGVASRLEAVAKVPFRHVPADQDGPRVQPFEPRTMGRLHSVAAESWQQWTAAE